MKHKQVWIDTDLAVGMKRDSQAGYCDVDDGFAVLQLLYAKNVEIKGISTVFGNTSVDNAFAIGQMMSSTFAEGSIPVYKGADGPLNLANPISNDAIDALAVALKQQPLIIMAIGPATNVGLLLLKYPELHDRILEVILVAGRRKPTDYFTIGKNGKHARDLNFDLDNDAFRVLFEMQVPVVLCPFELSSKVWLTRADLDKLKKSSRSNGNHWLAQASEAWLEQWLQQGAPGFNPFDVLASHYIISPETIMKEFINVRLEIHPDDTISDNTRQAFKQYLICDNKPGFPVTYCYDIVPDFHKLLLQSLQV